MGARRRRRGPATTAQPCLELRHHRLGVVGVEQADVAAEAEAPQAAVYERGAPDHTPAGAAAARLLGVEGDGVLPPHGANLLQRPAAREAQAYANALRGAEQVELLRQQGSDREAVIPATSSSERRTRSSSTR
jgi:hypothetical protein